MIDVIINYLIVFKLSLGMLDFLFEFSYKKMTYLQKSASFRGACVLKLKL